MANSNETNPDTWHAKARMGIEYESDNGRPVVFLETNTDKENRSVIQGVARFVDNDKWGDVATEILEGIGSEPRRTEFFTLWKQCDANQQAMATHALRVLSVLCMACFDTQVNPTCESSIHTRATAAIRESARKYSLELANESVINPHYDPHGDTYDSLGNQTCDSNQCDFIDPDSGERCDGSVEWRRGPQSRIISGDCAGAGDGFEPCDSHKANPDAYPLGLILSLLWEAPPWVESE